MEAEKIKWEKVERIVSTTFPEEYEQVSRRQIEYIEERIHEGQSPYVQDQEAGGMHVDFGAAINVVAELMLATELIVAWYDFVKPAKEEVTYENFYRTMEQVPQIRDFLTALLTQELLRTLERIFDQITDVLMHL